MPLPKSATRPRPFAVRKTVVDGEETWLVYLPPETAEAVRYRGTVVPPAESVDLGTAEAPWVECAAAETGKVYLVLEFEIVAADEETGEERHVNALGWSLESSIPASTETRAYWPHLVWAQESGLGAVQYHLGSVSLGDPAAGEAEQPEAGDCTAADDEDFPSRIDETATGPSGTAEGRTHVTGDGGLPSEGDGAVFPSKVDVCW